MHAYDHGGLFCRIRNLLRENLGTRLSEISRLFGADRHTLTGTIRENTGFSFREFRERMLLEEAVRLLTTKPELSFLTPP